MMDYPREFYDDLVDTALPSARRVRPLLEALIPIKSAVDVGCGNGGWLAAMSENGVDDIVGLDGEWVRDDQLLIDPDRLLRCSLDRPLPLDRHFDLAISLEVAEHLLPDRAADFVAELVRLAPVVLFSAAIPGQGGVNHVNEQWPEYWAALFAQHSYSAIDTIRWQVWSMPDVTWWYKQNTVIYASSPALKQHKALRAALRASPAGAPLAVVHPEVYNSARNKSQPSFGRWLRMGKDALGRSANRRP